MGEIVYYTIAQMRFFLHHENDIKSFRFITSQLVICGTLKQIEISNIFGVSYSSVKRSVKRLKEVGNRNFFYKQVKKFRSPHVLTPEKASKAQKLLCKGYNTSEVAKKIKIKPDTIRKAIQLGKLCRGRYQNEKLKSGLKKSLASKKQKMKELKKINITKYATKKVYLDF
jgi:transposase